MICNVFGVSIVYGNFHLIAWRTDFGFSGFDLDTLMVEKHSIGIGCLN